MKWIVLWFTGRLPSNNRYSVPWNDKTERRDDGIHIKVHITGIYICSESWAWLMK